MIKKTITYTDYDGNQRTEDFYFNLTKAETIEMSHSVDGGLVKYLQNIISAQDNKQIVAIFKDLVLRSYGEKSPDGRRFIKNDEVRDAFSQTEAYSEIFMELCEDAGKAAEFVNAVIPKLSEEDQAKIEKEKKELLDNFAQKYNFKPSEEKPSQS